MGKRERKQWDLLSGQGAALVILGVLYLAGGLAGGLFAGLAGGEGARELSGYLVDYLTLAGEGSVARSFWPVLWEQLRYFLAAAALGLTAIGVVGLPVLFCARGFLFAFSVGCLVRVFGAAGLIPALVLFGIPALLWTPALFLAGIQGLSGAQSFLRRLLGEGRGALPLFTRAYWLRLGLCGALFLLCGLVEYTVVPVLLRAAARVVL